MKKIKCLFLMLSLSMVMIGCGEKSAVTNFVAKQSDESTVVEEQNDTSMTVYMEGDILKNYGDIKELFSDAKALVKVEVKELECSNVRSYIYTSYHVKVSEIVYGDIDNSNEDITVNLPGGIIEGEEASKMISEVAEGKDAGDLSQVKEIVSTGNTDKMLEVGDVAYLFLIPETNDTYAVVGEYKGVAYVEGKDLLFDKSIELEAPLTEDDFRTLIDEYIYE